MTLEELRVKNKVIMLIDDSNVDNFINEKVLKQSNFAKDVYVHSTVISALEFLKNLEETSEKASLELIPSYIFLDINLPMWDGFYFLDEFAFLKK